MAKTELFVLKPENYFKNVLAILRDESKTGTIIYITTNKPYASLVNFLSDAGLDTKKIFVIDCISRLVLTKVDTDVPNCIFLENPKSITAMGIAVGEAIKNIPGEKILFVDSLSALLLYNDMRVVGMFSNFLVSKMRAEGVKLCVLALESDMDKDIVRTISSFVDEVKKYG